MTIIEIFNDFIRSKLKFRYDSKFSKVKNLNLNLVFLLVLISLVTITFFSVSNYISAKNLKNQKNFKDLSNTDEFSNLTNYFISKISSPYGEIEYLIQKNDSIEKILNKFEMNNKDIKFISTKLKQKKLSNIYSGRKLKLVFKKLENNNKTVINLVYPISNTSSIEIRKYKDDYIVKENILKLYKKEVVVKSSIKNNLYNSAINSNIEPNIIVEFARIFGFEVDFQRDIRKGDWFEIFYEKFEDDNNKVRDTGKIIYASMFVNGEEINLYNFKYKGDEEYYDIKGKSITKSLMKTPINGARLSSSFE